MTEAPMALALSGISFLMAVIWGPPLLRILKHFKIGKVIRVEGPNSHISKMGTPTMGGVMFIAPVALLTILLNSASLLGFNVLGRSVLLPVGTLFIYGILGMIDDWEGIRGARKGIGMRARTKFLLQIIIATFIGITLKYVLDVPEMFWPSLKMEISLGIFYVPIAIVAIVGFSNAINLTDGLDGLAGLISATAFTAFGAIALIQGQFYLGRFCFTLVGAIFGFLWFNVHPAQLFMGDTGSLALGATLGVVALMTGQWLLLPIIAIIPLSETLSVMLQVTYFKLSGGQRLLKMSPLHHHFELSGWSETQVVQRFWLVSLIAALIGIALALI
ncbi:MAG: phospho-N-acetylmuramoyl-pentapeptide-transferase [Chloroflexi bacterium HGW-Chloroflexi-2]|jgi:phospho-N-acetylmuramoyl-pentapeptide-transferase|nr:MAG: phospho-N-acetylmuramoyl-pentapeptide-transferase [Chloroflexi bacterium HGW-Chloroflexi-2]